MIDGRKTINVFHVPFTCRGFTEEILNKALSLNNGKDYSNILYLAPTPRKVKDSQQIFHKLAKGVYVSPDFFTIKQFSKKLYSSYGDKIIIPSNLIPILISRLSGKGIGFSALISNFIDEIKQYNPDKDIPFIKKNMEDVFKELNIPEESVKRAFDAIRLFEQYAETLGKNNAIDENDMLNECPGLIERHDIRSEILILDGFYDITPSESQILKKLIENSATALITIPHGLNYAEITNSFEFLLNKNFNIVESTLKQENGSKALSYVSFTSIDEEIEGIAKHIKSMVISGKCKSLDDIYVAFPKLQIYREIVERVFSRYGIQCVFLKPKPLSALRPFSDLLALLESIDDDYPRLYFSRFLISPFFPDVPAVFRKWMPKLSIMSGIIKGKNSWLALSANPDIQKKIEKDIINEVEDGLKSIFKKLSYIEAIKESATPRQFCDSLNKLIDDFNFSDTDADFKEIIKDKLRDISILHDLIPQYTISLRQFIDELKHFLNIAQPASDSGGVKIADFFELRGIEPEYLYFGGLRDSDFPAMPEIDLILPDSVRTRLGLVNMQRYLYLQKFIFQRLADSSKNRHLSYPEMEENKFFLPSPFLPWGSKVIEHIPGIWSKADELLAKNNIPLTRHINEIGKIKAGLTEKKYGKDSYIRVTDIDNFRRCPRKFFIEQVLNFQPADIKEYEIEAMLLGSIIHIVMEKLLKEPFADYNAIKTNAEKILMEVLGEQQIENYWKNFIKESFVSILPEIFEMETELLDEGSTFKEAEKNISEEIIKGIKLKGKIDRINQRNDSFELLDYKTSSAALSSRDVLLKGANLQLFLYAALLKAKGFKVNRVGIYSLKDIGISLLPGKRDRNTIDDYLEACLKYLEETVSDMRKGDFKATPIGDDQQECRNCHERPYCPYIQTAD